MPASRPRLRVLVIEDEPSVRGTIELILRSQGHTCEAVDSGTTGLEAARKCKHDIIVLDLTLPDMDGYQVLRGMRSAKVATPVLILSGRDDRSDKIKGLGIGADDYVTKPFDKDELLARIHAIVRRAKGETARAKVAALDGTLLARRGQASPWSFSESYTAPQATDLRVGQGAPAPAPSQATTDPLPREPGSDPSPASPRQADLSAIDIMPRHHAPAGGAEVSAPPPLPRPDNGGRIIVLGNSKGGTGKSTMAMHLVIGLLCEGARVGSIDLDAPQATLTRYIENRRTFAAKHGLDLPMPTHHDMTAEAGQIGRFDATMQRLLGECDFVVVDTPGHDSALSRRAHGCADSLVTPVNDSLIDLDVLAAIEAESRHVIRPSPYSAMVQEAKRQREQAGGSIDWVVLRNRLSNLDARNKRAVADVLARLAGEIGFRDGPGLSERVIYRELFLSGLTLLDLPNTAAAVPLTMSHVAARQELRTLLDTVKPQSRRADRHTPEPAAATSIPAKAERRA